MNPIVEQNIKIKIKDFAEQLGNYPEVVYSILLQLYRQEELNFDEDGRAYNCITGEYYINNAPNEDVNKESELEL